ncbi:rRNA methyltransferase [Clostridium botulinum]|uniref:Ribosomal RNA methyltransferase n=2 Tax=Clostridium botulinum TaxID=1491 RepID=B1IMR6_CLOBK|nr:hypothetical protein [Clostridium botulinum]EKX79276.1 ribosomal RNA methyltransferase [Clostridium botulinum CFSAN001628]ACA44505.1 ribosomal RNA methyltransferase [Clostridium botulinum B1 str. Okra]AUN01499.1 rRNA methyltransferase [Clostridium botulinum]AUN03386.1 rRNA methyltransferase [Clostridium botulinum]EDT83662.1 ribosomal RNA methyltransferase [Clostridium botulinum Bf]
MCKSMYIKNDINNLSDNSFIYNFAEYFKLKEIKKNNYIYFFENKDMIVKIEPSIVEFLLYDGSNREIEYKIKNYFLNKKKHNIEV